MVRTVTSSQGKEGGQAEGRKNIHPLPFWVLDRDPVIKDRLTREKQTDVWRHSGKSEVPMVAWNSGLNTIILGKEERRVDL